MMPAKNMGGRGDKRQAIMGFTLLTPSHSGRTIMGRIINKSKRIRFKHSLRFPKGGMDLLVFAV
jgi:hypothetical protein